MLSLDHFGLTDPGRVRENNEDSLLSGWGRDPVLFAVADGVGGFEAGEVASSMVIESLEVLEPGSSLEAAIREANRRVYAAARGDEKLSGMGTTVVAARIVKTRSGIEAEVAHVGDSRAYLLRDGELSPLTEDHSLVAELVRSGSLTRAQASEHPQKNLITRALGAEEEVEVDSARHRLQHGDRLVLCSDGLPDMVTETRISELAASDSGGAGGSAGTAEESARSLISAALSAGGSDNVTVVVVDVEQETRPAPDSPGPPAAGATGAAGIAGGATEEAPPPADTEPSADEGAAGEAGPSRVRRRGGRDSQDKREGGKRSRRSSGRRDSNKRGSGEKPAREAGRRGGSEGPSHTGLGEGGSLIPGVWDGAVVEEEPEPSEPTPEEIVERYRIRPEPDERETQGDQRRRRRRKRLASGGRAVSALIRGLAVIALLGLILVPPYLWWSTRYFMAYEGNEVVIHQGVPYDFLGNELNRVDQRTGVEESDIAEPYRDQIRDNRLYTQDRLQTVLEDLQKE